MKAVRNSVKIFYSSLRFLRYMIHRYILNLSFLDAKLHLDVEMHAAHDIGVNFFGYYNLSPANINESVILLNVTQENVRGSLNEPAKILLKWGSSSNFKEIAQTNSWNWQQGCMLQWGATQDNVLYFNDFDHYKSCYITRIFSVRQNSFIESLPLPIYCISNDESYALSLNFERLAIMRPDYGYFCNSNIQLPDDSNDGIWKIDLNSQKTELIITLQQLKDFLPVDSMEGAQHKVNHIDISKNGERFMFLHRWVGPMGRFMRLITADKYGKDLYILNGDKMTSHSCWWGDNEIISFCYTPEYGNAYTVFSDKSPKRRLLSKKLPTKDGHPSVSTDGKWMLTDSYPELDRMSRLYLYNIPKDNLICIGRFFQPLKFSGEKRIDLHPKWSKNEDQVFFESGHSGKRSLYSINLSKTL